MAAVSARDLPAFSTLSVSAVIAIAGMVAGCIWGIRTLEPERLGRIEMCSGEVSTRLNERNLGARDIPRCSSGAYCSVFT